MSIFLRHRAGEDRRSPRGRFALVVVNDGDYAEPCCECDRPIRAGQTIGLLAVGPTHLEEAAKADDGRWYNALAIVAHERCLWPDA